MSVAFTREEDSEAQAANLPDRPISPHQNLVTPSGLAALEAAVAAARAAYTSAQAEGGVSADRTAMARATRDLRYYAARRGSAQLVEATGRTAVDRSSALLERMKPTPPGGASPTYLRSPRRCWVSRWVTR